MSDHYTIAVQRWPLPLFKHYHVVDHDWDVSAHGARLNLYCADGVLLSIPRMDKKKTKLYPSYKDFKASKAAAHHT